MEASRITGKPKIVVIMGSTGAGKSRLSVDLATGYFKNSEIINCDKIQVYSGLDITTNKISMQEQSGVPHHLLGTINPKSELTPSEFRELASKIISGILSRGGLPVIVGGSTSLIYALVASRYDMQSDGFNGLEVHPVTSELRYDCCFIWVDVCLPVLNPYLSKRVDEMLDAGMFEELQEFFRSGEHLSVNRSGLGLSIGVPEYEKYLEFSEKDATRQKEAYDEAVRMIKENTYQLAEKQVTKIMRLRDAGWDVKKIDATNVFRAVMTDEAGVASIWDKQVVEPTMKIVKHFLDE
ncbi:putative transferase [Helianthus anomalus]